MVEYYKQAANRFKALTHLSHIVLCVSAACACSWRLPVCLVSVFLCVQSVLGHQPMKIS